MNRDQIYEELARLTALADRWRTEAEIPAIERDLMLERLRGLYGSLIFESMASSPAQPLGAAAIAAAEEDETNEIIDIVLDDFEEPASAAPDAVTAEGEAAPDARTDESEEPDEEALPEIEVEIVTDFESAFADGTEDNDAETGGEQPADDAAAEERSADAPHAEESEPATTAPAAEEPAELTEYPEEAEPAAVSPRSQNAAEPAAAEQSVQAEFTPEPEVVTEPEPDVEPAFAAGPAQEEPAEETAFAGTTEEESAGESEDEPVFIVETPADLVSEPETEASQEDDEEVIFVAEPAAEPETAPEKPAATTEPQEDDEPEFIVEPAPAAVETPAAQPSAEPAAAPQNNLFGFESVTAPRRSRQRMISLYDDDLFERIPARKADKAAQASDEPQFEVVTQAEPEHRTASAPQPAEAAETVVEVEIEPEEISHTAADEVIVSDETVEEIIVADSDPTGDEAEFETATTAGTPAAETGKVVLGDVLGSDRRTIADSMAAQRPTTADALAHTPVADLAGALSIGDRYRIESELFGGDAERCRQTLEKLDGMESLDDAVIYIEEHFSWHPSSEAACMIMELLERKFS